MLKRRARSVNSPEVVTLRKTRSCAPHQKSPVLHTYLCEHPFSPSLDLIGGLLRPPHDTFAGSSELAGHRPSFANPSSHNNFRSTEIQPGRQVVRAWDLEPIAPRHRGLV
jgi:hypothetical protein